MGITYLLRDVRLEPGGPAADLCLRDGHLEELRPGQEGVSIEGRGGLLLPGMIDPHVHLRSPGMEAAEGWESGTRAAARGGVTTVFDMPNTRPPATTRERLDEKRALARGSHVNWGLHLGATAGNAGEIARAGAIASVKVYMGSSTGDLLVDSEEALEHIFGAAARAGVPVTIHAEDEGIIRTRMAAGRPLRPTSRCTAGCGPRRPRRPRCGAPSPWASGPERSSTSATCPRRRSLPP